MLKQTSFAFTRFSSWPGLCAVAAVVLFPSNLFAAEEKIEFPAASQHAVVKQRVGLTDVEIDYSRPNKNNREIFGGLVPFDKMWRTGANDPTRIKFSGAVKLGDKEIPAGEYLVYTIPGANEWTIILSKNLKAESVADYKQDADAARITAKPVTLAAPAETFTIGLEDLRANSATLYLEWDKTRVPVKLTTNDVEKVSKQIETATKSSKGLDPKLYYSAANFYYDQNKDLAQALKWLDQAIEKNPKAYFMFYKKAQVQAKLGNKQEAIAAAEKSTELLRARPDPDQSAIRNNQLLIDSLR
jgi:tetratricopeptide (TPR) repeat protein